VIVSPSFNSLSTTTGVVERRGIREDVIELAARREQVRFDGHRLHARSRDFLEMRQRADMVHVRLRRQQDANVFGLEAKLPDRGFDQSGGRRHRTVDQDMPLRRRDEISGEIAGADVVNRPHEMERFDRIEPGVVVCGRSCGRRRLLRRNRGHQRACEQQAHRAFHAADCTSAAAASCDVIGVVTGLVPARRRTGRLPWRLDRP
jgi:hypothetical protein